MSVIATAEEVIRHAPEKPWGWKLIVELDFAFNGPLQKKLLPQYLSVPDCDAMAKGEPPQAPGMWAEQAACKGQRMHYTQHTVHTNPKMSLFDLAMEADALATCERCPVLDKCRAWALTLPDPAVDMVAGGMTPRQRYLWRREHR